MKPAIEELRKKYIENPPEGMTPEDIHHMSEDDLLDMDYFRGRKNFCVYGEKSSLIRTRYV